MRTISLLLALLWGAPAPAAGPSWPITDMPRFWILGEGNTHFSVDGFYFHTKENYGIEGTPDRPVSLEHVRYGNIRFHAAHGFTPRLSLFAQADLRGLFMVSPLQSNVSDDENYGFGDAFLGMRWLVHRSRPTDRVYPTEWSPETWLALIEASWLFPMYDHAKPGKPPLGDQSNDFTIMGRATWYINHWLGVAGNAGFTYRTAAYDSVVPWGLRADLNFLNNRRLRFWLDFQAQERVARNRDGLNTAHPDPFANGSLLFKSLAPVARTATVGAGYRLGRNWELAGGVLFTASGLNAAKGIGGTLGLVWRPYQIPELSYEDYRRERIRRLEQEPRFFRHRKVLRYGFQATVLKVSHRENFFRIGFGRRDGVKAGDVFHVLAPDDLSGRGRVPLAQARVQVSRENDSFLRVEHRFGQEFRLQPGHEVRRVIVAD
jgi:hypothetical protein